MNAEEHRLVRATWERIRHDGDAVATTFYETLFEQNPAIASLFDDTDMRAQRAKFLLMISEIVRVLDHPEILVGEVADSGRRHVTYRVRDRDYDDVGAALLRALERHLGDEFTPAVRDAWRSTYELVAAVMRRAANRASNPGR